MAGEAANSISINPSVVGATKVIPQPVTVIYGYYSEANYHRQLDLSECIDWTPWRKALGIVSSGGGYVVEYIFFILYSVCVLYLPPGFLLTDNLRYFLLLVQAFWSERMPPMRSIVESPKSKLFSAGLLYEDLWALGLLQLNQ
jgi:hypothetical protein